MSKIKKKQWGQVIEKILDGVAELLMATKTSYYGNIYFAAGKIIKILLEEKKLKQNQIKRSLNNLKKRKLIYIKKNKDQAYVYFTKEGKRKILKYSLRKILALKKENKKWKGYWFIVFFDVPEEEKLKRDYLRKFLKYIGFISYQKSVYIFPFECKEEVNLIKKMIDGGKYIRYVIAKEIEDEQKYRRIFHLH